MRYDAFISYRHAEADMFLAQKLHKSLETFRVPRAIRKKSGKKSIKRVFRDQDELPIGSDLGDNIVEALKESEYLIVICSPRTPESEWVQREIETFIELHDSEHVLAVLIEGEPSEAFPKILLSDEHGKAVEPLAADVRGKTKKETEKKLKEELLRILAPLLSCSYDDLRQRHRERRLKKIVAITAVVACLGVLFGIYNAYNTMLIRQNYEQKQINQSKYLANKSIELLEEGDRKAAALVALEALPNEEDDRPYVALAQYALTEAVHAYDTGNIMKMDRVLKHDLPVSDFYYDKEGTILASVDQSDSIYVWDLETGEKLLQVLPSLDENGYVENVIAAIPFEDRLIVVEDNSIRCISHSGKELWKKIPEGELSLSECQYNFEDEILICQSGDLVCIHDIRTGDVLHRIPNRLEHSFSMEIEYSEKDKKCAISHNIIKDTASEGYVTVYDLQKRQQKDYVTQADYIQEVVFAPDGDIVVASSDSTEILSGQDVCKGVLQKLNSSTGAEEWGANYEYLYFGAEAASLQLKSRSYRDALNKMNPEIIMSIDNGVYSYDAITGEELCRLHTGTGIRSLAVAKDDYFGYISDAAGTLHIMNTTNGTNYSGAAIETGKDISQLEIKNSTIAIREKYSSELTIMKYHTGYGMEELETYSDRINEVWYTGDEQMYAVETYVDSYTRDIYFYDAITDQQMGCVTCSGNGILTSGGFVDEETYYIFDGKGYVYFYDVAKGKENRLSLFEEDYMTDCYMTKNGKYLLAYQSRKYAVVDLKKQKVVDDGEFLSYFYGGILSEDGKYIYGNQKEVGLTKLKAATGEATTLFQDKLHKEDEYAEVEILIDKDQETDERAADREKYQMITSSDNKKGMALSSDGCYFAVSCKDYMLRIFDLEKLETVAEVPYAGVYRSFIGFIENDTKLLLQGDDYYIRIYDIEKKDFAYIAMTMNNSISRTFYHEQQSVLAVLTSGELLLMDTKSYQPIVEEMDGACYMPSRDAIYMKYSKTLYRFPYMTLEQLCKEAKEQFGDARLTREERIRYAMDNEGDL